MHSNRYSVLKSIQLLINYLICFEFFLKIQIYNILRIHISYTFIFYVCKYVWMCHLIIFLCPTCLYFTPNSFFMMFHTEMRKIQLCVCVFVCQCIRVSLCVHACVGGWCLCVCWWFQVYEVKQSSSVMEKINCIVNKVQEPLHPHVEEHPTKNIKHLSHIFSREKQHL